MSISTFTVSSPLGQFSDIVLSGRQLPTLVSARPTHGDVARFEWSGIGTAAVETALRNVAVPANALVNGAPDLAMSGRSYAQTLSTGYLVQLAYAYWQGPVITQAGLLVVLSSTVGPNSPSVHSLQVAFYPMTAGSRLYYADGSTFAEVPA